MADRKYPIVLVCSEVWKGYYIGKNLSKIPNVSTIEKLVHNDTEYNSFIDQHKNSDDPNGNTHELTERKPTWEELDGNIFKRGYNWLPKWAVGGIAAAATYVGSHVKDIWEFIKPLFQHKG